MIPSRLASILPESKGPSADAPSGETSLARRGKSLVSRARPSQRRRHSSFTNSAPPLRRSASPRVHSLRAHARPAYHWSPVSQPPPRSPSMPSGSRATTMFAGSKSVSVLLDRTLRGGCGRTALGSLGTRRQTHLVTPSSSKLYQGNAASGRLRSTRFEIERDGRRPGLARTELRQFSTAGEGSRKGHLRPGDWRGSRSGQGDRVAEGRSC
jgi:hypothetical protein